MTMTSPPPARRELDDTALVERARGGDRGALGELLGRHHRAALRVAAVIAGSTEEADDIVQDAYIKVARGLATFQGRSEPRSWILRVVANEAKNHVRSRVRRLRRDDRHAAREIRLLDGGESDAIGHLGALELAAALGRLRADDRAVLGCRYVADLSEAETADVLALPRGTVKSRTARALERLRQELEDPR